MFFKQRDNLWFPAWAFVLPGTLVRLPISFYESLLWVVLTYFEVGLTLDGYRCGSASVPEHFMGRRLAELQPAVQPF